VSRHLSRWKANLAASYVKGVSIVLGSNSVNYIANTDAVKKDATGDSDAEADLATDPIDGNGGPSSNWLIYTPYDYFSFNDLISSARLKVGDHARTRFHTLPSIGGAARYICVEDEPTLGWYKQSVNGWVVMNEDRVNVLQFGAIPNNNEFDSLAAFDESQQQVQRGRIYVPAIRNYSLPTIYYFSSRVVCQGRRKFVGDGVAAVRLRPIAGYTDSVLAQAGENGQQSIVDTGFEQMTITSAIYGTTFFPDVIAGYSNCANEQSGFADCKLSSYDDYALLIDTADTGGGVGSPKNFAMNEITATKNINDGKNKPVISLTVPAGAAGAMDELTIIGGSIDANVNPDPTPVGLEVGPNSHIKIGFMHVEDVIDGAVISNNASSLHIEHVNGEPIGGPGTPLVNIVRRDSGTLTVDKVIKRGAVNAITDNVENTVYTDDVLSYSAGVGAALSSVSHTSPSNGSQLNRQGNVMLVGGEFRRSRASSANVTTNTRTSSVVTDASPNGFVNLHDVSVSQGLTPNDEDAQQMILILNAGVDDITIRQQDGNQIYSGGVVVPNYVLGAKQAVWAMATYTSNLTGAWFILNSA